jgi:hypothetical protein
MRTTKRDKRLTVRVAGPLLHELESAAQREGRTVADEARRALIAHFAERMTAAAVHREQPAANT